MYIKYIIYVCFLYPASGNTKMSDIINIYTKFLSSCGCFFAMWFGAHASFLGKIGENWWCTDTQIKKKTDTATDLNETVCVRNRSERSAANGFIYLSNKNQVYPYIFWGVSVNSTIICFILYLYLHARGCGESMSKRITYNCTFSNGRCLSYWSTVFFLPNDSQCNTSTTSTTSTRARGAGGEGQGAGGWRGEGLLQFVGD